MKSSFAAGRLTRAARALGAAMLTLIRIVWRFLLWETRHYRWSASCLALVAAYILLQRNLSSGEFLAFTLPDWPPYMPHAAAVWAAPGLVTASWATLLPRSYELLLGGPLRRWSWRRWAKRSWFPLTRECGLAVRRPTPEATDQWVAPRLLRIRTDRNTIRLIVRARLGQTADDLAAAVPAIGAAARAESTRCVGLDAATVQIDLVMRDALGALRHARLPADFLVDHVPMGRRQDNSVWDLQLRGRHTLVTGCSGAGKGSVFWGICGGLGPAAHLDIVRLWAIDLKRVVEVGMGAGLFATIATNPSDALAVLRALLKVIDQRGDEMAGWCRLHEPRQGDPLHVLVIDELAALTAYGDAEVRREASRLLAEILTQGRALGVVVVACVQDPRKEVVGMRGLFTQTIALRLRSVDETRMVLGDGMAGLAPAHRLSARHPGTAWIVDDAGNADRVRADFWSDDLIRHTADVYRSASRFPVPATHDVAPPLSEVPASRSERKPRSPRTPRVRSSDTDTDQVRRAS